MITVAEAERILSTLPLPARTEQRALSAAMNMVLAESLTARSPSPPFTNSAMDGFAVRYADYRKFGPEHLFPIVGESAAGHPYTAALPEGAAVKISTGAPLPPGSDTVVPIEVVTVEDGAIRIHQVLQQGQHVKVQGKEFLPGDLLLPKGTLLLPPQLALIASQGIPTVTVFAPPRVAVLVSGDELVDFTETPAFGQIRDSNSLLLQLGVEQAGAAVAAVYRLPDQLEETIAKVRESMTVADVLLSSGGVSVGEHDYIRRALQQLGFVELFWRVKQKPGKPMFVATSSGGEKLFFGLPGNPVSAYLCFVHYVYPLLRRWYRHPHPAVRRIRALLKRPIQNSQARQHFVRVRVEETPEQRWAYPLEQQASYMLTSIAAADGYIAVPPDTELPAGAAVEVWLFPGSAAA